MPTPVKVITRRVKLEGFVDIMFDPYSGDNAVQLPPDKKFYFDADGKSLVIPALNIMSFICAEHTTSAAKLLYPEKQYKRKATKLRGVVTIDPFLIPLTRKGKRIVFKGFDKNGIVLSRATPRLKHGIPNPKPRPVVNLPWALEFNLTMLESKDIDEHEVKWLFEQGGALIGLGTYRGVFGKFHVTRWS